MFASMSVRVWWPPFWQCYHFSFQHRIPNCWSASIPWFFPLVHHRDKQPAMACQVRCSSLRSIPWLSEYHGPVMLVHYYTLQTSHGWDVPTENTGKSRFSTVFLPNTYQPYGLLCFSQSVFYFLCSLFKRLIYVYLFRWNKCWGYFLFLFRQQNHKSRLDRSLMT